MLLISYYAYTLPLPAILQKMCVKKTFTILTIIFSAILCGQDFAIISDKDGFANIRENANSKSKIIDKLKNGHLICVLGANGNWLDIDYSTENENQRNGSIYKNRIKYLSEFKKIPKTQKSENKLLLSNQKISVIITLQKFDKKKHKFEYVKEYPDQILKIDNKKYYGKDGGFPETEYQNISVNFGKVNINLPKSAFQNLYEPNLFSTEANYDEKNNILYISAMNSDGAGSYLIVWKIENGKYKERFIPYGF